MRWWKPAEGTGHANVIQRMVPIIQKAEQANVMLPEVAYQRVETIFVS